MGNTQALLITCLSGFGNTRICILRSVDGASLHHSSAYAGMTNGEYLIDFFTLTLII
jgi:hypothetical protein